MKPWHERPAIAIPFDAPRGQRFAQVPSEAVEAVRRLTDFFLDIMPRSARWIGRALNWRTGGRFRREAKDVARLTGVDWSEAILVNLAYDYALSDPLATLSFGCSTAALATPSGPVLARNMDFAPAELLAQGSYLLEHTRGGSRAFCQAGWPGAIGVVTGMSARGFAVALNAVLNPERVSLRGYPIMLLVRRVLEEAASFDDAVAWLGRQRLTCAALFAVVGSENHQRVIVERTPTACVFRRATGGEPLVATNDFRQLRPPSTTSGNVLFETTCRRYDALSAFFADQHGQREVSDDELLYALTDASVRQSITAQHVIFRPRQQTARVLIPAAFREDRA